MIRYDNDMLPQLRLLYVKSNRLLQMFHGYSAEVKPALLLSYCTCFIAHSYGHIIYKQFTHSKLRAAFNNVYRRIFKLPPRSRACTMYAINDIDNLKTLIRKGTFGCILALIQFLGAFLIHGL